MYLVLVDSLVIYERLNADMGLFYSFICDRLTRSKLISISMDLYLACESESHSAFTLYQ